MKDRIAWIKERIKVNEQGCWEWRGWRDRDGYGRTKTSTNGVLAYHIVHRWMWELHNGPIPEGKMICHHCDNPACININHLYLGDAKTNRHDCLRRKRAVFHSGKDHWMVKRPNDIPHGAKRGQVKLNEEIVRQIRRRKKERTCSIRALVKQLALEYSVCSGTISKVIWNKTWTRVV